MAGHSYFVFALVVVASLADAQNYCRLPSCQKSPHTMCVFSPNPSRQCIDYQDASLTSAEKREILNLHNKLRARVATGRERSGAPGPQPRGRIGPLQWDDELAEIAQRWANQCSFKHDSCRDVERFSVGQNIAERGWSDSYHVTVSELVQMWYDEVEDFDGRSVRRYTDGASAAGKIVGHYTQLVWGETTHVGCGLVRYKKEYKWYNVYLVCNYGPAGNTVGSPVYQTY